MGTSAEELESREPASPNPFLAFLAPGVEPDFEYWTAKTAFDGLRRARTRALRGFRSAPSASYAERERAVFNRNDALDEAEPIPSDLFGSAADEPIVEITGTLEAPVSDAVRQSVTSEDAASGAVVPWPVRLDAGDSWVVTGRIGDGPFAATSGDVDVFEITVGEGGLYTEVSVQTPTGDLDPVMSLYDPYGNWVFTADDSEYGYDPYEAGVLDVPGTYRLYVWGYGTDGLDVSGDAGSGAGAGSTGPYELHIANADPDVDSYAVELKAGDVLAAVSAAPVQDVTIYGPGGEIRMRSQTDITGLYPEEGPLLSPAELGAYGGGVSAATVAPEAGKYIVAVRGEGDYTMIVQGARPGHERPGGQVVQTLYVETQGGTYHPGRELDGTRETTTLTPLREFLPRWGLTAADEDAVVDEILKALGRVLRDDLRSLPGMAGLDLRILNDRDHPDPGPGANRLILAGTQPEIGADGFLGQASTVDVGNFRQDDVAYVLLDLMSDPRGIEGSSSINQFAVGAGRTKVELVGLGVGTVAAHEAGHFFGLHHTENDNDIRNVQDAGGYDLAYGFDIGADRVFGPGDGRGVRFRHDDLYRNHAFAGVQRSPEALAYGLHSTAGGGSTSTGGGTAPSGGLGALDTEGFSPAAISAAGRRTGTVLLSESFDADPTGVWTQDSNAGQSRLESGVLRMTGNSGRTIRERGGEDFWVDGDFAMRVELRHVGGCETHGAGFYFNWSDGAYNLAFVDAAGETWTRINRYTGSEWDGLTDWERTDAARADDWNTLELVVRGTRAQLFLNGEPARTATVPAVAGQRAVGGLLVNGCEETAMEYLFDDFSVVSLDGGGRLRSFAPVASASERATPGSASVGTPGGE